MIGSAVRELSASRVRPWRFAAGLFKEAIQIWDLQLRGKILDLRTQYLSGAGNLAISPCGQIVVLGVSERNGTVAAFEINSGTALWRRTRLVFPSTLSFNLSGEAVFCTVGKSQSVLCLDVRDGATKSSLNGIQEIWENPRGGTLRSPATRTDPFILTSPDGFTSRIPRISFAVLDAAFSRERVLLTEAAGPVRCIDWSNGMEVWRYQQQVGSGHVVRLYYSLEEDCAFGVEARWDLQRRGKRTLLRFDLSSGTPHTVCEIDSWYEVFIPNLDRLVTSSGQVWDIVSGAQVLQLDFPVREYPGT